MGRLTEYFEYLQTPPEKLMNFKFRSAWITIKDEDKKLRRKLKLYNKTEKNERTNTTTNSTAQTTLRRV